MSARRKKSDTEIIHPNTSDEIIVMEHIDSPIIEPTIDKAKLQALYNTRPMFIGREYSNLHKWYAELEKLL